MKDGSVFDISKKRVWLQALEMKMQSEGIKDAEIVKKIIKERVEKHWKEKTVLTKFGDTSWENWKLDKIQWELEEKGKFKYPPFWTDRKEIKDFDKWSKKSNEWMEKQRAIVKKEYDKRKIVPDKIFKNMAELTEEVFYYMFRGFIMGIAFSEISKGRGKTILLGDDGSKTAVGKDGFVKVRK